LESLEVNLNFWRDKKVFLTGHTGFKGSWLSLWLQSLGAVVTGYALNPKTQPNLFELANVAKNMHSIIGDIRDLDSIKNAMKATNPDIVIHMAAQPLVRYSYSHPVETYATNVMGTVHLLEAARENKNIKAILNVTSDKCYENKELNRGYKEDDPMGGFDPYSNSKGCAELVTSAYRNSFFNIDDYREHGVALATGRAGNVIGGGDWAEDRLVPDLFRAFINKKSVAIRNPNAIRPWQHVLEPLRGYLTLTEKLYSEGPDFAESFNFGPQESDAKSVEYIANYLVSLWQEGASWSHDKKDQPHEAHFLKLDIHKAKDQLGWEPRLSLDEALRYTSDWYRSHEKKENMHEVTIKQIKDYLN
jgi:CDP-glucose 4,6-dehydratase